MLFEEHIHRTCNHMQKYDEPAMVIKITMDENPIQLRLLCVLSYRCVLTPTDRPKSVRNRCVIELFCGVVCVVTLPFCRGVNQKVFFSRSIAVLRHKNERNLGMMLQNTLFSVFLTMLYNE